MLGFRDSILNVISTLNYVGQAATLHSMFGYMDCYFSKNSLQVNLHWLLKRGFVRTLGVGHPFRYVLTDAGLKRLYAAKNRSDIGIIKSLILSLKAMGEIQ